jgi:glycosyltransferase involved in cell wall biosynthesis
MLCYNDRGTARESVESVLELSKYRRTEIVVVDNLSTDGSREVLRQLRDDGKISLIERRCTRGAGRQIGFESTSGEYILSHMDCDDIFDAEGLDSLLSTYHSIHEGKVMMTQKKGSDEASNITVGPRQLLGSLGGWRDLNWGEDWDLWARAAGAGQYAYLQYPMTTPPHRSMKVRYGIYSGIRSSFKMRRTKYADAIRSGRRMFKTGEKVSLSQRLIYYMAKGGVALRGDYLVPVPDPDFSEFPPESG